MAVQSTTLSTIINRMRRYSALARVEDQYLVRDLDEAIRKNRRMIQLPWTLKKGTLKVFPDILEYPVESDYDEMAYLDNPKDPNFYPARARFRFTSIQQFYEDLDYRNDIAEIRDGNDVFLGVRYRPTRATTQKLSGAEDVTKFSGSGDVTSVAEETVNVIEGNKSVRVNITNSSGVATITNTFDSVFVDANYKRKYHFKRIYLAAVPTSITLRFRIDNSNYLETTGITTQFSGQPLKANAWNVVAHDLNTATVVGTIGASPTWASEQIILNGAATGTYYVDDSHLRSWELLDFWYYSKYHIATVDSTIANQEYFFNASEIYSLDSKIIGDSEWHDVIMYDALETAFADLKETEHLQVIQVKRAEAWNSLMETYPSYKPVVITQRYRLETEYNNTDDVYEGL